jgi:transcription-repair coupling factor (superfamily II helicase)
MLDALFHYERETVCEAPGQFAVRGGLVDVYPLNAAVPVRVDFFGDEVESIRVFDPTTQRSEGALEHFSILATSLADAPSRAGAFVSHLPSGDVLWVFVSPPEGELKLPPGWCREGDALVAVTEFDSVAAWLGAGCEHAVEAWDGQELVDLFPVADRERLGADRLTAEEETRELLLLRLAQWQREGFPVKIVAATEGALTRIRTLIAEAKARWKVAAGVGQGMEDKQAAVAFSPQIVRGELEAGFILRGAQAVVFATDRELFHIRQRRLSSIRQRRLLQKSQVEQLLDFNELVDGDMLVHLQHGMCLYRGINKIADSDGGEGEEMISLEFDDAVRVHLPLREAHLLSRYVGLRKAVPKLGRIGGNSWEKTRRAAEKATVDFAAELLALHARRQVRPGIPFPADELLPWMHEFESSFPYAETPDQARAIAEAKHDMESLAPMDRLLCGDVGFGKTEVALRTVFKAVMSGFQAVVLAPTTVLAQQHFNTFRDRFAKYPFSVEMLSRFRTPRQRERIVEQLNEGRLDVVVGTHALLSPSVKFPKLGLLVIDEEHRFGVRQKELVKRLREGVDVLCMSATPIPRTLHLALMGARDLSVIETPPRERLPIRTVVRAYEPGLVCDAIHYEVSRGGQVFYLHNRVETIESVAERLREMLPGIRFKVGHGQMGEEQLEHVMTAFVAGEFDVLVCTTIIETGLDIPNCNTLIIEGADRFGLAQLYQLRGRVGRFNRQAYAYLLLHRHAVLLDPARKRLSAIRQHNQLGAGLRVAMRDLELRGTGNLLGREQSGHIAGVGFDLYCQLLRQSIARLRGEPVGSTIRADVRLDFVQHGGIASMEEDAGEGSDGEPLVRAGNNGRTDYQVLRDHELEAGRCALITATLPASYIADARLRIEFFRKFAMVATREAVGQVSADMEDRFGKMPASAKAFVAMVELRVLAEACGIAWVETEGSRLKCRRAVPARDGSIFLRVGEEFPRLSSHDPMRRIHEIRAFLLRQPQMANPPANSSPV